MFARKSNKGNFYSSSTNYSLLSNTHQQKERQDDKWNDMLIGKDFVQHSKRQCVRGMETQELCLRPQGVSKYVEYTLTLMRALQDDQ